MSTQVGKIFGQQNAHVMASLRAAPRAVDRLIVDGFTVHSVEARDRNPVIWIAACERCASLGGAAHVTRTYTLGTRTTVMVATVEGCQVQWVVS
jgi:hypothetical protein